MHQLPEQLRRERGARPVRSTLGLRRGFTLVELLVTISIITVLITIMVPSLRKAKGQAKGTLCKTNLRSIYLAQTIWLEDRKFFQPLNNEENDGKWQYNYLIYDGRDWKSNFGPLVRDQRLLHDVSLLYCPFQKSNFYKIDSDENPWWPKETFDSRAAYGRRHLVSGRALSQFRKNIALFSDVLHMPTVIRSGHKRGVNVIYLDGHVSWVQDPGILTNNDLGEPFDVFDNPVMDKIWRMLDRRP